MMLTQHAISKQRKWHTRRDKLLVSFTVKNSTGKGNHAEYVSLVCVCPLKVLLVLKFVFGSADTMQCICSLLFSSSRLLKRCVGLSPSSSSHPASSTGSVHKGMCKQSSRRGNEIKKGIRITAEGFFSLYSLLRLKIIMIPWQTPWGQVSLKLSRNEAWTAAESHSWKHLRFSWRREEDAIRFPFLSLPSSPSSSSLSLHLVDVTFLTLFLFSPPEGIKDLVPQRLQPTEQDVENDDDDGESKKKSPSEEICWLGYKRVSHSLLQ